MKPVYSVSGYLVFEYSDSFLFVRDEEGRWHVVAGSRQMTTEGQLERTIILRLHKQIQDRPHIRMDLNAFKEELTLTLSRIDGILGRFAESIIEIQRKEEKQHD